MFASVVPTGKTPIWKLDAPSPGTPLISTSSPTVSGRFQYLKLFQQPVFSDPEVPGTAASIAVFVASATPGRIVGAPRIVVPPPAAASPTAVSAATSPKTQRARRKV